MTVFDLSLHGVMRPRLQAGVAVPKTSIIRAGLEQTFAGPLIRRLLAGLRASKEDILLSVNPTIKKGPASLRDLSCFSFGRG